MRKPESRQYRRLSRAVRRCPKRTEVDPEGFLYEWDFLSLALNDCEGCQVSLQGAFETFPSRGQSGREGKEGREGEN